MDEETFESLEIKLVKTAYVYQVKKAFSHFYLPTHRLTNRPSALFALLLGRQRHRWLRLPKDMIIQMSQPQE